MYNNSKTPQQDVPAEVITHYIVKDYRRMFNERDMMIKKIKELQQEVDEVTRKRAKTIDAFNKEREGYQKKIKALKTSVTLNVDTTDLRERLDEANKRIKVLAQAISANDNVEDILHGLGHVISTKEEKAWMNNAMKKLEKAEINFQVINARLVECKNLIGEGCNEKVRKKIAEASGKIDSCISRIDDFFHKVGNLKVEDNG